MYNKILDLLNNIDLRFFNFINTATITSVKILKLIFFLAEKLIIIFPLITVTCWFLSKSKNLVYQRTFVCKTIIAIIISLVITNFIGMIYPHDRPFVFGIDQYLLNHASTPSFPSNHATIAFTFTFSFLFWLKKWVGLLLFIPAISITLARIFLGLHWISDVIGGFLVAVIACEINQIIWKIGGNNILVYMIKTYEGLLIFNIKNWMKN